MQAFTNIAENIARRAPSIEALAAKLVREQAKYLTASQSIQKIANSDAFRTAARDMDISQARTATGRWGDPRARESDRLARAAELRSDEVAA